MMIKKFLSGLALALAVTATAAAAQSPHAAGSPTQPGQDQVILEGTVLSTTDQSVLLRQRRTGNAQIPGVLLRDDHQQPRARTQL